MENKLNSTRTITISNIKDGKYGRIGLLNLSSDKLYTHPQMKLPLLPEHFKLLEKWNDNLLKPYEQNHYQFARSGKAYVDYCYIKVKTEYDNEAKQILDKVRTKVYVNNKQEKDLSLSQLQELFINSSKCTLKIKASSLFHHKGGVGVKYLLESIKF